MTRFYRPFFRGKPSIHAVELGERGRLARRFRPLAENFCTAREDSPNGDSYTSGVTGWRDASQRDRDGRAPKFKCIVPAQVRT
jgi:hypothetical protein